MEMIRFNFSITSPENGSGHTYANMLPDDGENELMLLSRACREILEHHPDSENWQITGMERVIGEEIILVEPTQIE